MSAMKSEMLWTRRKMLTRVALGSAAWLALAACGGGGGDDSSGSAQALRDAFAKLREGMTTTDVEALVGFNANDWRSGGDLRWIVGGVTLYVSFFSTGSRSVNGAKLTEADGVTNQYRSFGD